jgi:succinyl-CoA synthetase alpha subunit
MGHAGAIVSGEEESAEAKKRVLRECGVHVVDSPADIGEKMAELLGVSA